MCGRFTATFVEPQMIAARFAVSSPAIPEETLGRYNVCPTEQVLAVVGDGSERAARDLRWGLVPPWARKLRAGPEPINARAETLLTKRAFAPLLARADRRCLVIADGWYEWLKPERPRGERVPFRYTVDGGAPFAFAGLWDENRVDGERLASVTVLTTAANAVCAPVHDRMPCVLGVGGGRGGVAVARRRRAGGARAARRARRGAHGRRARQPGGQQGRRGGSRAAGRPGAVGAGAARAAGMSRRRTSSVAVTSWQCSTARSRRSRRASPGSSPSWGSRGSARRA